MITNTATQRRTILDGMPGMIEASEARGQKELVESQQLPIKIRPAIGKKWLADKGVIFGDKVEGDDLFQKVTLPTGWKLKPTDHSMWSELRDEKDVVVGTIFYKAAFYDRDAFLNVETVPPGV